MKTFTSPHPKHIGYTFSDAGIVWTDSGTRKTVHTSSKGEYVIIQSQRYYLDEVYDWAVEAGLV